MDVPNLFSKCPSVSACLSEQIHSVRGVLMCKRCSNKCLNYITDVPITENYDTLEITIATSLAIVTRLN